MTPPEDDALQGAFPDLWQSVPRLGQCRRTGRIYPRRICDILRTWEPGRLSHSRVILPVRVRLCGDGCSASSCRTKPTSKEHYHKRSNVETVFSMVKGKFGPAVRAKSDSGQMNEILLKFLCHNLCVINQEAHELGLKSTFGPHIAN